MSSNVIGQQDGLGVYKFTNLDNKYGGATTELLKMEEGKVTVNGGIVVDSVEGVSIIAPVALSQPLAPSSKEFAIATGDTAVSLTVDKDVIFVDNANTSACDISLVAGTTVGAVAHIACTGTGTVTFVGDFYNNGSAATVGARGGITIVCLPSGDWQLVGIAA